MAIETLEDTISGIDPAELDDWFDSLEDVLHRYGPERLRELLVILQERAYLRGVTLPFTANTPYINTIPVDQQAPFPGDKDIERRIKSIIRWNALAMVHRANKKVDGIGGHISTFASSATLYEIGYNHFFHARTKDHTGDMVYFQGHASPGMYARAFVEGRLDESHLENFRQELPRGSGLSSYPHPYLMPDFWQFPTVSMGLGPITAIYHARFLRYLENRGLLDTHQSRVWCFMGDGECDEPESLGALTLASREKLDNLTFVINCNLQRLDGPVRGNGKIIQELEAAFRGAGWNCIKVIWGGEWDDLLARDTEGKLVKRMGEIVDGQYQKYSVSSGQHIREHFFYSEELQEMVAHLSDDQLQKMRRGGHDTEKVYAAYKAATEFKGSPTVILAKTIKGYGLGESGEGKNIAHNVKKANEKELLSFRSRFGIPINDEDVPKMPFYRPQEGSVEYEYLHKRREELGGYLPARKPTDERLEIPPLEKFSKFMEGSGDKPASTTFAYGQLISFLLSDKTIGKRLVPIIPDEARTFGMEGLFKQVGIYAHEGQRYEPVDRDQLMYYKEARDGQVLEEGINEAGAVGSFIAAGTAYSNLGLNMIPFYTFYSMFGFQRVGDLIWCAADSRTKGFLVGGTSGRTTLNGEGLQHQDGHSQLVATTIPTCRAYDPCYAYELVTIIQDGLQRMYGNGEECFYYLSVYNDNYLMIPQPEGDKAALREGIIKGLYQLESTPDGKSQQVRPQLWGSGPILVGVRDAARLLKEKYDIGCDVWSVTSYSELCRDAMTAAHWNKLHPAETPKTSFLDTQLAGVNGPIIASSDNVRLVPEQIREWIPNTYITLGTDGFGRSETRKNLRDHFEIDARHTAYATLVALSRDGHFDRNRLPEVLQELGINPDKVNPLHA